MTFLGIDIGFDRCGYAVLGTKGGEEEGVMMRNEVEVVSAGVGGTDKGVGVEARLRVLYEDLVSLKKKYEPNYVSIEKLFFHRKNMTFEKICMAKGVAMLAFYDCEILEIEPKRMKREIIGDGNVKKSEIRPILEQLLGYSLQGVYDDTIDAVCLALYHERLVKFTKQSPGTNPG